MRTRTLTESRPFGIGTRTEIRLDDRIVTLSLQAGDMLRSEGGLVWATIDGRTEDILLERGDVHVVVRGETMRVSAFGAARLEVYGNGPLRYEWPQRRPTRAVLASAWHAVRDVMRPARARVRAPIEPAHAA